MINQSRPSTSITNSSAPYEGESWDSDLNTWNNETRTWLETGEVMDNTTRPTTSITNLTRP